MREKLGNLPERNESADARFGIDLLDRHSRRGKWTQNLAAIRDPAALAKLPADEQKAFTQFWGDVAALKKKVTID